MAAVDPAPVLEMIAAFRRSKIMFAGVELGVFDALDTRVAEGTGFTAKSLAEQLHCEARAMARFLDACVGLGLLERDQETYRNTPVTTAYLCQSSPQRMTGYIRFGNSVGWRLWEHLEDAVREGTNRWEQTYGSAESLFSHFFRTEESKREFLMGMHGFGLISSPHVVRAFDLSRFKCLADLGGATGHLVIAACEAYPHLQGIVFDLQEVTPLAREIVAASSVSSRIEVLGGDFFNDPLPAADLYALGRIVHDWGEEKIHRLLRRIYEALPAGGALLIAEKAIAPQRDGPPWAQLQDVNMLICAEGRERTMEEYRELLSGVGFGRVEGSVTDAPLDAILAWKTTL